MILKIKLLSNLQNVIFLSWLSPTKSMSLTKFTFMFLIDGGWGNPFYLFVYVYAQWWHTYTSDGGGGLLQRNRLRLEWIYFTYASEWQWRGWVGSAMSSGSGGKDMSLTYGGDGGERPARLNGSKIKKKRLSVNSVLFVRLTWNTYYYLTINFYRTTRVMIMSKLSVFKIPSSFTTLELDVYNVAEHVRFTYRQPVEWFQFF